MIAITTLASSTTNGALLLFDYDSSQIGLDNTMVLTNGRALDNAWYAFGQHEVEWMDDDTLLQLANRPPVNIHALLHGGLLPPGLRGAAEDIMAALEAARTDELPPPPAWTPMRGEERARFERLTSAIDRLGATLDLPAGLLLSRAELERLARGQTTLEALHGWRGELLREPLGNAL